MNHETPLPERPTGWPLVGWFLLYWSCNLFIGLLVGAAVYALTTFLKWALITLYFRDPECFNVAFAVSLGFLVFSVLSRLYFVARERLQR